MICTDCARQAPTLQVLVAAVDQTDYTLPEKLNLQTDAIIGNQCDRNSIEMMDHNGHDILYLNFKERGVGLNRNNAWMRASADIVLFADDDMRYVDDYPNIVREAFRARPDADVILFNLIEAVPRRFITKKAFRVRWYNILRFGAARIAAKTEALRRRGICFNLCFGGGAEYSQGEDSLFLTECLKKGLVIYAAPVFIAELTEERDSTWFKGYTEKFFSDHGALYAVMAPKLYPFLCLQDAVRKRNTYQREPLKSFRMMMRGAGKIARR